MRRDRLCIAIKVFLRFLKLMCANEAIRIVNKETLNAINDVKNGETTSISLIEFRKQLYS